MPAAACRVSGDLPLVQGLLNSVDCNLGGIVETGYAALIGPGSQFQTGLTVLLTLYIAILGLRVMLGLSQLRFGELTITVAKIGVVLALATNWPTYQRLVVDVLFAGPQEIAAQILGNPGRPDGPYADLQLAFDEMQTTANYFAQRTPAVASPFVGGAAFGAFSLNASSMIMLLSTLGVVLASKIVLTALLAFGPVFIAFFLFDATRGLFVGWLRASILFAIAPLFALLALVFQLLLIQPHLVSLVELRAANQTGLSPAIATLALTTITATVSLAGLVAIGLIATGLKLPSRRPQTVVQVEPAVERAHALFGRPEAQAGQPRLEMRPRAISIAAAASALERRDARAAAFTPDRPRFALAAGPEFAVAAQGLGGHARARGLAPNGSASSRRRDR